MVKILSRTPSWLSRPSPGQQVFQHDDHSNAQQTSELELSEGASRKLAHRGTELFVAVGNELRWSDLVLLQYEDENGQTQDGRKAYRVLKTPVSRPIRQLLVSTSGDFITIITSHTCHVGVLPASSHLGSGETTPLRMKCFQVGPTTHVLEQAPLVSALWHPLSSTGNCLVTVAKDACVRMWELDRDNRSTFDDPSLAVDLKKLANASDARADLSASKYGVSKGFSPDNVEMQVAAACFGGQGTNDEHGWSSMTLWVAMTEGDVYALCPFLPSKWRAPGSMLPSLTTSVVSKMRASNADNEVTEAERRVANQQTTWLAELDGQDAMVVPGPSEFETMEVYSRPERPGMVPKLQGPFYVTTEVDSGEITDIFVIAPRVDEDDVYDGSYEEVSTVEGLSVGIVCLATTNSKVHICLDIDGVEAEWLPSKRSRAFTFDDEDEGKDLLLFETLDLSTGAGRTDGCSTFTLSPRDREEVLVTTPAAVIHLDFKSWTSTLDDELTAPSAEGLSFRLGILLDAAQTGLTSLLGVPSDADTVVNTAIAVYDPINLGGIAILTSTPASPLMALLECSSNYPAHSYAPDDIMTALPAPEVRAPYQPAEAFYQISRALPHLIKNATEKHILGSDLKGQVRYSSATLQVMTEAHRILSAETHKLGLAAADLFRRCERMRSELADQVKRVHEIAGKVEGVVGGDDGDEEDGEERDDTQLALTGGAGAQAMEKRVEASRTRTAQLHDRVEGLRRKMASLGGKELSAKEKGFAAEVQRVSASLEAGGLETEAPTKPSALLHMDNSEQELNEHKQKEAGALVLRFGAVRALQEQLKSEVERVSNAKEDGEGEGTGGGGERAAGQADMFRMRKLEQVRELLERETALVEGVGERLKRLAGG
ncbi:hypothetical protein LTR62_003862 [Meristemomyces frigidus]|uniref:Uncharacterized protein n=1 Tax=Meristemomyces frigidus TaxID=1508187 RepID=A0AAN7TEF2_9PEZI|nr:hypothetical protein LTR62_003862 [Meristemomyces frigidus]